MSFTRGDKVRVKNLDGRPGFNRPGLKIGNVYIIETVCGSGLVTVSAAGVMTALNMNEIEKVNDEEWKPDIPSYIAKNGVVHTVISARFTLDDGESVDIRDAELPTTDQLEKHRADRIKALLEELAILTTQK